MNVAGAPPSAGTVQDMSHSSRRSPAAAALGAACIALGLTGAALLAQAQVVTPDSAGDPAAADSACASATFRAQLLTPTAGRIPRDMGLVVGLVPGGTLTDVPTMTLDRRRRSIATRIERLAPGLARVVPDAPRVAGRYTLTGVQGAPELLFSRAAVPPPPAQPRLERLERYVVASSDGPRTELKAHFGFPIPNGVVAVLVYLGDSDRPSFYARATPTLREALLHRDSGCPTLPEGSTPPPADGSLRVAFVDLYGHTSPISDAQSY